MPTTTAISATCMVNGKKVTLNAGDVSDLAKQGIVFRLNDPTQLGSPQEFLGWLKSEFGLDVPIPSGLPDPLQSSFNLFLQGQITLDTLTVDQVQKFYQFGISFNLPTPLSIVPGLGFDGIGMLVTKEFVKTPLLNTGGLSKTDAVVQIDKSLATGTGAFANAKKVQIDNETMVVSTVGTDGKLTVARDATAIAHTAPNVQVVLIDPQS